MAGTKSKVKRESLKLSILFPFPLYEKLESQATCLPNLGCVSSFLDLLINRFTNRFQLLREEYQTLF